MNRDPECLCGGHEWESSETWGVILGVSRCKKCHTLAQKRHFSWEAARGAAPDATGALSSEDFVRQKREEWDR